MTQHQRAQSAQYAHTLPMKGKRLTRLFALLLLTAGLLAGVARPASAEHDPARFDGNTYFGLDYGWSVTWDEDIWVDPYEKHADGFEYVAVNSAFDWVGGVATIVASDAYDGDVETCVENWHYALEGSGFFEDIERIELDQGIDLPADAAEGAYSYNIPLTDDPFIWVEYVQCRPLSDGVNLVVTLSTPTADYETMLPYFSDLVDQIVLDADQPAASDAPVADSETGDRPNHDASTDSDAGETGARNAPVGSGLDGASYTGVNEDWSVTWDGVVWTAPADQEDNSGGIDYFELDSTREDGAPPMVVAFETTDRYDGNLNACAESGADWVAQDESGAISNIEEADVRLPKTPADSTTVAFTYTYQRGEDSPIKLVGVQVCLPLDANGAILQVRLVTPTANYSRARGYFEDLIAAIELG